MSTANSSPPFDSVDSVLADLAAGRLVIVTDDQDRENEGDLIMAASLATPLCSTDGRRNASACTPHSAAQA